MTYRSREAQATWTHSGRFSLESLIAKRGDEVFDTPPLPRPMTPVSWTPETQVHRAIQITKNLRNSNQFAGTQVMIVRDEVRRRTFIITLENDGLYLHLVVDAKVISRDLVRSGFIRRAHISLRKYDGFPVVAYAVQAGVEWHLYVNDTRIEIATKDMDFPFLSFQQPPIGLPASLPPEHCILTCKCRTSGKLYAVILDPLILKAKSITELPFAQSLGGADFAIGKVKSLFRVNRLVGDQLKTLLTWSDNFGTTFEEPVELDLSDVPHINELPSNSAVTIDNEFNFHVPVLVKSDDKTILLDYHPLDNLSVAAIAARGSENVSIAAFPSMPKEDDTLRAGFGDGVLDGSGMIATLNQNGSLLVANSQSGGYSYADYALLNQDMQKAFRFRATECYSRGYAPNMVSMDYVFVEANDEFAPISSELWLETWDMPLPEPVVKAEWSGKKLKIEIEKSAWFFPGQTSFELDPANTEITKVTFTGWREAELTFKDPKRVPGAKISFSTKNVFYYYRASINV